MVAQRGGGMHRGGVMRCVLALALSWVALLVFVPGAFAAQDGGIEGKVTAALSHDALPGIEVTAYEADGVPAGRAATNAKGEYVIDGLAAGSYKVEFSAGFEGAGGNYVTQYYENAPSLESAKLVSVGAGVLVGEINAQMQVGGELKGAVTEANASEDIVPLKGVSVVVYRTSSEEEPVAFATTNSNGQYTVMGLPGGSYKIAFSGGYEEGPEGEPLGLEGEEFQIPMQRDFIGQFYKDEPSFADATPVGLVQEEVKEGINAELQRGAEIEGTVTDSATHAPISDAYVVAFGPGKVPAGAAFTEANGHYTIVGLPSGSYAVGFAASHHEEQFYDNQSTFASATLVSVLAPNVVTGINAALVPDAPVNTAAPVASGTPAVGQTLSCSPGTWTGHPTPTYTYAWLRDGVPISGATASTYTVQSADEGNGLTCKVTATNKSGSAAAVSNTLIVPVPSPPAPTPEVTVKSTKLVASKGFVRVSLACAHTVCAGTIELVEHARAKSHKGSHHHGGTKTVVIARGSYSLAAGHDGTITLRLSAAGKRALGGASRHRLAVTVLVTVTGAQSVRRAAVLSEAIAHKRGHSR
jgi:hypothetical protein